MERKEDTPIRVSRRKYEEVHREKRHQQNKVWVRVSQEKTPTLSTTF